MPIKIVKSEKPKEKEESVAEINNRGMSYLIKGMFNEAEVEFKKTIEKKPDYSLGHNNLRVVYLQQNRIDDAIKEFRFATKFNPNYAETFDNLGVAYYNKQKYTEAKEAFRKTLQIDKDYKEPQKNLMYLEEKFSNAIEGHSPKKEESPINAIPTSKISKSITLSLCM
jgi:Tfp pilus assembly protein PilF